MSDSTIDEADMQPQAPNTNPVQMTITGATPPATGHATRSATKKTETDRSSSLQVDNETGIPMKKSKKSPFDSWARRKAGSSSSSYAVPPKGTKRPGEAMQKGDESDGGVPVVGSSSSGNKKFKGGT